MFSTLRTFTPPHKDTKVTGFRVAQQEGLRTKAQKHTKYNFGRVSLISTFYHGRRKRGDKSNRKRKHDAKYVSFLSHTFVVWLLNFQAKVQDIT